MVCHVASRVASAYSFSRPFHRKTQAVFLQERETVYWRFFCRIVVIRNVRSEWLRTARSLQNLPSEWFVIHVYRS